RRSLRDRRRESSSREGDSSRREHIALSSWRQVAAPRAVGVARPSWRRLEGALVRSGRGAGLGDPGSGALGARLAGAAGAAGEGAARFDAVTDDRAAAVRALRRQAVNRALEAVEDVRFPRDFHLEGLVVVVSADFTDGHGVLQIFSPQ